MAADISLLFAGLNTDDIDSGIKYALKSAGEIFEVDRTGICIYSPDKKEPEICNQWCKNGIKPPDCKMNKASLDDFPWFLKKIKALRPLIISNISDLPPEAKNETSMLKQCNIISMLVIPLFSDKRLLGHMSLQNVVTERCWAEEQVRILQIIAAILSGAIVKNQMEKKANLLARISDIAPSSILIHDFYGNIIYANEFTFKMHGFQRDEFMSKNIHELDVPESEKLISSRMEKIRKNGEARFEVKHYRKNGSSFPLEAYTKLINWAGKPAILSVSTDITERKKALRHIEDKNRMLSTLNKYIIEQTRVQTYDGLLNVIAQQLEKTTNGVFVLFGEYDNVKKAVKLKNLRSDKKLLKSFSQAWDKKIFNKKINLTDRFYSDLKSSVVSIYKNLNELTRGAIPENISNSVNALSKIKYIVNLSHIIEGHLYGVSAVGLKKYRDLPSLDFLESYAHISAISLQRLNAEKRVFYLSFHDGLTNLYNRSYLEEEMSRLDTKRQLPMSIIMADVNGLKLINDTYGHSMGDKMLKKIAAILKKSCRKEDIVSRWGGDEFVICLTQTSKEQADKLCCRIGTLCSKSIIKDIPISLALGSATKYDTDKSVEDLLKEAEDAMYNQKLSESRSAKNALINAFLKALEEKSFETEDHIKNMQGFALKLGNKLSLLGHEINRLMLLVMLHDIGKINVPKNILIKKGLLSQKEWEIIKEHPHTGYRIALATSEFSYLAEDILSHHERWDGSGYPRGLKGVQIPLLSRIVSIVDAYEVMINKRSYKNPLSVKEAIAELKRCAGKQFDPELVNIFISIIEKG
ncbi:MAG: diguanylate cyclase [Actinobacteria bacterium]|nr:diguanylate cyclase [Actinomycetota bacterium]